MKPILCIDSRNRAIIFTIMILMIFVQFPLTNTTGEENIGSLTSQILYVGGNGIGNYSEIQNAIDNASEGDTVFVYTGLYIENLIVDKAIILKGENRDNTIINGGNSGDVPCIDIRVDHVLVQGFLIEWSDWEYHEPGIKIGSNYVKIIGNNISIHDKGINIISGAKNSLIENNIISNNHEGIYIWPTASEGHIIKNNDIVNNNYGFKIFDSTNITIENNMISESDWYGILMKNAKNNVILKNTFKSNSRAVFTDTDSTDNSFFHNNFIANRYQAIDQGINIWNQDYPLGGNYWSDYNGLDLDNDGIGDEPYDVPGRSENKDFYPFMVKNTWNMNQLNVSFFIPEHGFVQKEISFNVSIKDGLKPYQIQWNFGDGVTSELKNPIHMYDDPGTYLVNIEVIDGYNNKVEETVTLLIYPEDITPPHISIIYPERGLYINNHKISDFSFPLILMIGDFFVELKAIDEETFIEEIKIFINDVLFEKIRMDSFILEWPTSNRGYNEFKIIAIDLAGNSATKRLSVISY
jgi:nitrous oxidase accessory protein